MTKIIAVTLALAFMALANVAHGTGTGMPMMKGLNTPTELAALVDLALKVDQTGHSLLDPVRCKKDGSCATAHDYFYGIQLAHPSAKLGDIADLPRYLRSLVKQPAPTGEWFMSRLLVNGEKRKYDHVGWHRAFFKGEEVWDDPNTGEHILAGFCENIVGSLKSPAPEKETPMKVRDTTPAVTATVGCSKAFYTLVAHVWSCKALPSELCKKAEKLIAEAEARDTKNATDTNAYKPPDVSRSLYDDLIREPMAKVDLKVKAQTLNPQTLKVEDDLGELDIIAGIGDTKLTEVQRAKIVETIWPDHFRSPTMSGGKRRIWLFEEEWRKPGGGNWCIKHVSGLMH